MKIKRATIKDVAAKAEVSVTTVSYVLNNTPGQTISEATREKILKAVDELQYMPNSIARGMRTKKSMTIGLVSFWNITNHVFNEILEGMSKVAGKRDYSILFCNLNGEKEFGYVDLFKKQQIDGVVFISPHELAPNFDENVHVDMIKQNMIPAVILNAYTHDDKLSCIYFDYYSTIYLAVEYLFNLGHRNIGYLMPALENMKEFQASERLRGFADGMSKYELEMKKEFLFSPKEMDRILDMIQKGRGPSAIVVNKTEPAELFLKEALNRGVKIPQEVSVIAGNNEPIAGALYPSLTTVEIPVQEIGEMGTTMLLDSIAGTGERAGLTLPNRIFE